MNRNIDKTNRKIVEKEYRGLKIIKSWVPSNYHGTLMHEVHINGSTYQSPSWDNLKKQIRKKINADPLHSA